MAVDSNHQPEGVIAAVAAFVADTSEIKTVSVLGDGNINDTFLITHPNNPSFVLQRINSAVFPDPPTVARNGAGLARHLNSAAATGSGQGYLFPRYVQTLAAEDWHRDEAGETWRGQTFVENSQTYAYTASGSQAYEAGRLLGYFHRTLASLDHRNLEVPLPGFHDLGEYRRNYVEAQRIHRRPVSAPLEYCRKMAEDRLEAETLDERARRVGLETQVIHGDPKCANFLFDTHSDRAVSLIDLDTAAPGLTVVDIGDCLRSFCNPGGEHNREVASFNIDLCRSLIEGYRSAGELSEPEGRLIYHGARLLTYELGIRFLTDYLEHNRYFKVADDEENLRRAVVQFTLLESIEAQRHAVEAIACR